MRSIFLANLHTVKLADSPLGVGCGGIETAADGTLAAVVRGFVRPVAAQAFPVRYGARRQPDAPQTCAGRLLYGGPPPEFSNERDLNTGPVPQIADL